MTPSSVIANGGEADLSPVTVVANSRKRALHGVRRGKASGFRAVERDREDFREMREVRILREDREVVACGDSTNQEVSVGALDALRPAVVEERSSFLIINRHHPGVGKAGKVLAEVIEVRAFFDPGQDFLEPSRCVVVMPRRSWSAGCASRKIAAAAARWR